MPRIPLLKAHGCANDVFLIDGAPESWSLDGSKLTSFVRHLCDRTGPFGADGVYFIDRFLRPAVARYFRSNGSPAEYCGNGLRCLGRLLLEAEGLPSTEVVSGGVVFEVAKAPTSPEGVPNIAVRSTTAVQFGCHVNAVVPELGTGLLYTTLAVPNPHLVAIMDSYDGELLDLVGRRADRETRLFPQGVNTSFVMNSGTEDVDFYVETYERGTGFTGSCASGGVASAATLVALGLAPSDQAILIRNVGGPVRITIEKAPDGLRPTQSGNANYLYRVETDVESLACGLNEEHFFGSFESYEDEIQAHGDLWRRNAKHLQSIGVPDGAVLMKIRSRLEKKLDAQLA